MKRIKVSREIILNNFIWEGMHFTTGQWKSDWNSARKWWKHYARVVFKGERKCDKRGEESSGWESFQDRAIVALFAWILISSFSFWVNLEARKDKIFLRDF